MDPVAERATILEDIGRGFVRLAEQVNDELERRGLLHHEADADATVEAQIETLIARLGDAAAVSEAATAASDVPLLHSPMLLQALRIALTFDPRFPDRGRSGPGSDRPRVNGGRVSHRVHRRRCARQFFIGAVVAEGTFTACFSGCLTWL